METPISHIEPMVSLKLSDYNKIMKYMDTMESALGSSAGNSALEELLGYLYGKNRPIKTNNNQFSNFDWADISQILKKQKISMSYDTALDKIVLNHGG